MLHLSNAPLTIAYSKIKKTKSSNKDAYQRETLTKWPVRLPLTLV